ncbi:hypothetical protein HIRU_S545 [Hirudovirus strain Sangsue]|nr:hypothetical protein HIRU_S545 [Hirudovirus strain Sangsue]
MSYFYEKCNCKTSITYSFFMDKLEKLEKMSTIINNFDLESYGLKYYCQYPDCKKCQTNQFYQLENIIWPNNIRHIIKHHHSYPSKYFTNIVIYTVCTNDYIINPPIKINTKNISDFSYVQLSYNKLLIIDALFRQGSYPRYLVPKNHSNPSTRFIYSEHSGVLTLKNSVIDNIIVSTESSRIDSNDTDIYLPTNIDLMKNHEFLFHTHPNSITYAGRLKNNIIYEFPSANDILNFIKYHNTGIAQASIIVAPEGIYVIRPIEYNQDFKINLENFTDLKKYILKLENKAVKKLSNVLNLSDPDIFHENVSHNFSYIKLYNKYIRQYNIFVEFYPRKKKNNEWILPSIYLQRISTSK